MTRLLCLKTVVVPQPLPRDGAWRKTMKPQKPVIFPAPGAEIVERRVAKEYAAGQSWDVMKGVLGRMVAGAAWRILDSADSSEIRV